MIAILLLLGISVLPVVLLCVYIYRQDKYEPEPPKMLIRAFIGGILAIPLDLLLVSLLNRFYVSDTVFYSAFLEAGFPEELSKFLIFMILIWRNKNFDEYMDGIVYATFIGLGFACIENIMYVFGSGFGTGIMRAIISVPGHFLFGVLMGYFLSLAKFSDKSRGLYLILALLIPAAAHGLFDWMLMVTEYVSTGMAALITLLFIIGDIILWIVGVRSIRKHRENSQFKNTVTDPQNIDWNAGFKS